MPSIEYEAIYQRALTRIKDTELASMQEEDFYSFLLEWMHSCISEPYFRKKFSSFVPDDDMEELSFEIIDSVDEYYDVNFVTNIIAKGLIVNYFPSKLEKSSFLNAMVYGSEEKWKDNYKNAQLRLDTITREYMRELSRHGYYFGSYGGQ